MELSAATLHKPDPLRVLVAFTRLRVEINLNHIQLSTTSIKVKFTLEQVAKGQRNSRVIPHQAPRLKQE